MSASDEDPDLLAAEFVLGTMEPAAAQSLARRAKDDPALASAIQRWQEQLDPLTELADPTAPDATLWQRLEAAIGPVAVSSSHGWNSIRLWRGTAVAALAVAAALVLWIVARPPLPVAVATLTAPGTLQPAATASVHADGTVTFHLAAPLTVAKAETLNLWALPAGTTEPRLLGAVHLGGGRFAAPALPAGSQLMVTADANSGATRLRPGRTLFAGVVTGVGSQTAP